MSGRDIIDKTREVCDNLWVLSCFNTDVDTTPPSDKPSPLHQGGTRSSERLASKAGKGKPTATGQHSDTKRGLSADFQDEGEEEESVHLFVGSKKKNFTHYFSYSACVGNIALVKNSSRGCLFCLFLKSPIHFITFIIFLFNWVRGGMVEKRLFSSFLSNK